MNSVDAVRSVISKMREIPCEWLSPRSARAIGYFVHTYGTRVELMSRMVNRAAAAVRAQNLLVRSRDSMDLFAISSLLNRSDDAACDFALTAIEGQIDWAKEIAQDDSNVVPVLGEQLSMSSIAKFIGDTPDEVRRASAGPGILRAYVEGIIRGYEDSGANVDTTRMELLDFERYLNEHYGTNASWDMVVYVRSGYSVDHWLLFARLFCQYRAQI